MVAISKFKMLIILCVLGCRNLGHVVQEEGEAKGLYILYRVQMDSSEISKWICFLEEALSYHFYALRLIPQLFYL